MLRRTHVHPYTRERGGDLEVLPLLDRGGSVTGFLDRVLRIVRRLEGSPRSTVTEALKRQERRVRDARRLAGIAKLLLDLCQWKQITGAERAPAARQALFSAGGACWPPDPQDQERPYRQAAESLGCDVSEVRRLLYADSPVSRVLGRAPSIDAEYLLARYNLELARGVLLDASEATVTSSTGWRDVFRAVKLARLMFVICRNESSYSVTLTGPAAPFVVRRNRYGARLARVVPALVGIPGAGLTATVLRGDRELRYEMDFARLGGITGAASFDSAWEEDLAGEFATKLGEGRHGWSLTREATPISSGGEIFLPDFTLRHDDGREALVEIVGFWTPEYLRKKVHQVRTAGLGNLILVVYRGLAAGELEDAAIGPVIWFGDRPRIGPVLEAAERVAQ